MNQTVYRILQITILLVIISFIILAVKTSRYLDQTEYLFDFILHIVASICFTVLFFIMERDKRRDEKK